MLTAIELFEPPYTAGLIIAGLLCLGILMLQRWFWLMLLSIGSLASGLEMVNSFFHLHFPSALGFLFAMVVCWSVSKAIVESYSEPGSPLPRGTQYNEKTDAPDWSPN